MQWAKAESESNIMIALDWITIAVPLGWLVYLFVRIVRFRKLCRQRTAVYKSALAAAKRDDDDEFRFLHEEWKRLAAECERRMGVKQSHEPATTGSPPL